MESELASSRSSASLSPQQVSTRNATTTDVKKSGGRKRRRQALKVGVRRRKRPEMAQEVVNVVHGEGGTPTPTPSHAAPEEVKALFESGGGREVEFVDEEAIFNMPLLMDCMAEGMLLTPPALKTGFCWTQDDVDDTLHFPLFHP